jgi:hypothetical protein
VRIRMRLHAMPITQDSAVTLRYTLHELLPNGSDA